MTRCALCPRHRPPVPSVGPKPARVLFLGEGPSYEEDRLGEPFKGKTGIELTGTYMPIVGVPRSDVHIFNAMACSNKAYENPTPEQAMSCSSVHLGPLLAEVQPEVIVVMGAVACSLFPEIENLNLQHGRPLRGKWGSWSGILFPSYHPSAGIHSTGYMISLMQDFNDLGKLLRNLYSYGKAELEGWLTDGWTPFEEDLYPNPDYQVIRTLDDQVDYFSPWAHQEGKGLFVRGLPLGTDTESTPDGRAYCLTVSHTPGTGRLIYTSDTESIRRFRNLLEIHSPELIFHNYLHDIVPFTEMYLPIVNMYDTMVRAYNLCLGGGADDEDGESRAGRGSLSLKILAYRYCNMRMTSFRDTVFPHSVPMVRRYLADAQMAFAVSDAPPRCKTCGHPQTRHTKRGKAQRHTGVCLDSKCLCTSYKKPEAPTKQPDDKLLNLLYRKVSGLLDDIDTQKPDLNPWDRLKQWHDHDHRYLEDILGPWPVPSIAHVPEKDLLQYACRDSDADLRLKMKLDTLVPWVFWEP